VHRSLADIDVWLQMVRGRQDRFDWRDPGSATCSHQDDQERSGEHVDGIEFTY
jgi:hypothetical protein